MRVGNLANLADQDAARHQATWRRHDHVGDMEDLTVRCSNEQYSVWDEETLIAAARLTKGDPALVRNIWVSSAYRNQRILSKLLWYFKTRELQHRMILGPLHSRDTQLVVSKGLKSFTKSWFNLKTGEVVPLTPDTIDIKNTKFYSHSGETEWRVLLEMPCTELFMVAWPKFREHQDFMLEAYSAYIE